MIKLGSNFLAFYADYSSCSHTDFVHFILLIFWQNHGKMLLKLFFSQARATQAPATTPSSHLTTPPRTCCPCWLRPSKWWTPSCRSWWDSEVEVVLVEAEGVVGVHKGKGDWWRTVKMKRAKTKKGKRKRLKVKKNYLFWWREGKCEEEEVQSWSLWNWRWCWGDLRKKVYKEQIYFISSYRKHLSR